MNQEQVKSAVRWLVSFVGGFVVAKGWIKADQLTALLGNEAVMGALAGAGVLIWGLVAHTQSNAVAVVAAMPEVKAITVSDQALATAAKSADPSTNVQVKP